MARGTLVSQPRRRAVGAATGLGERMTKPSPEVPAGVSGRRFASRVSEAG